MREPSLAGDQVSDVRHCSGCEQHVHDLSTMTELDARRFLARNGTKMCVTFSTQGDRIRFVPPNSSTPALGALSQKLKQRL